MLKSPRILFFVIASLLVAASAGAQGPPASTGKQWSVVPSPNRSIQFNNDVEDVSCASQSFCMAAGEYVDDTNGQAFALIESWDGTAWALVDTSDVGSVLRLGGVSCTSASFCMAVGSHIDASQLFVSTLILSWNGTEWLVLPSPNADTSINSHNDLFDVSCTSPSFCMAVGTYNEQTLTEAWNGSAWSVVSSPAPGNSDVLRGVSCTSPSFCGAVGSSAGGTLTEFWNGTAWRVVSSPTIGTGDVWGISCASSSSCLAVGRYLNGGVYRTLIEAWIGVAWVVIPSPNIGLYDNALYGVSCPSGSCVAVGSYGSALGRDAGTLVLSSPNSRNWSAVSSPSPGTEGNWLGAVSCMPTKPFCMAAGGYWNTGASDKTLFEVRR